MGLNFMEALQLWCELNEVVLRQDEEEVFESKIAARLARLRTKHHSSEIIGLLPTGGTSSTAIKWQNAIDHTVY